MSTESDDIRVGKTRSVRYPHFHSKVRTLHYVGHKSGFNLPIPGLGF